MVVKNDTMEYLGTYTICPNNNDIEVDCYGTHEPAQRETLEQEGITSHNILEAVKHCEIDITDYIPNGVFDLLSDKVNEK
ncbi:MAG: hypothetical protein ABIN91_11095 [Mucilaginibacter sp.]|uniref:hypothetical protein n=1 Tax=Mucilaginibacter sp. TaxID=1882438 RepID=UPI00326761FE